MMTLLKPLLFNALLILVQVAALVIATYVAKYLKVAKDTIEARMGKEQFEKAQVFAKTVVYAIEQQYPNMAGNKKYESAVAAINEKLGNILTQKEINSLIEAAVCEINLVKKAPGTNITNIPNAQSDVEAEQTSELMPENTASPDINNTVSDTASTSEVVQSSEQPPAIQ